MKSLRNFRIWRSDIDVHQPPRFAPGRAKKTLFFILKALHCFEGSNTLVDIAGPSEVGKWIFKRLWLESYAHTRGDLDSKQWAISRYHKEIDIVLMLEVIEHLMNPLLFFKELKKCIHKDTLIFITYPSRPSWLWTDHHFHEMRRDRFEFLMDNAGYEIVDWECWWLREPFWKSITGGIRPFFRYFLNWHNSVCIKWKR